MDRKKAHRIIKALADGRHPGTGRKVGQRSPLHDGDVVRALHEAMRALEEPRPTASPRKSKKKAKNAGEHWTPEADAALIESYNAGADLEVLANQYRRSRGAIKSRLKQLGVYRPQYVEHGHPPA